MVGVRVFPVDDGSGVFDIMKPGEYGLFRGIWYAQTPNDLGANLAGHTVVEHEDGTITVSPSILVRQPHVAEWHGYLEHGVWREVK